MRCDWNQHGSVGPVAWCHVCAGDGLVPKSPQVFQNDAHMRCPAPALGEAPSSRPVTDPPPLPWTQPTHSCRVIEFVGTPGSGKSTIERALREALVARGHKAVALGGGLFKRWAKVGRHRVLLTPLILLTRFVAGGLGTWRFFFQTFGWRLMLPFHHKHLSTALVLAAKHAWLNRALRSRSGDYLLFCEFFVNSVAKDIATTRLALRDGFVRLSNFYNGIDVLFVQVDTPIEDSLRRLESRTRLTSHVQKMEKTRATAYLERFRQVSELCATYAASRHAAPLIRVSGVESVESVVQQLLKEMGEAPVEGRPSAGAEPLTTAGSLDRTGEERVVMERMRDAS